jgi:hypothetical protein
MTETVEIHLQEGFKDDTVIIRADGHELSHKDEVTTKLLLGYADVVEIEIPEGQVKLEIMLPSRNISKMVEVQIPEEKYLGVSVRPGGVEVIKSRQPFGYA